MNESRPRSSSATNFTVMRFILGFLLLLPAIGLYRSVQLSPAIDAVQMSTQDVDIFSQGEPENVGSANYDRLAEDPIFGQAIGYSLMIVFVRVLIVALIPPLVGVLIGSQRTQGRMFNRWLLAGITVLLSPIVLGLLWAYFTGQLWGQQPSPIEPRPEWMILSSVNGARMSIIVVDSLTTLGIAAVAGGTAFISVMRGRSVSPSYRFAGVGIWFLGILLTLASLPQTFDLPMLLTNGGPIRSTMTLPLYLYQQAFMNMHLGYAAALATPMIAFAVIVAFFAWAVIVGFRLRLMFTHPSGDPSGSGMFSIFSVLLLVIIGFPLVGLILWGVWLTSANPTPEISGALGPMKTFLNTIISPWATIWFIQIPITYLAGLSLGFVRPVNRIVSNILFLVMLVIAFIPAESLIISWFMNASSEGRLNSLQEVGTAWLVGSFSLILFKMFFDGAFEKFNAARSSGQTPQTAFVNTVFLPSLPIVALVGSILSFASLHSLLWPLIVTTDPSLYSFSLRLASARSQLGPTTEPVSLAVTLIGVGAVLFLPLFTLLHTFVLDRLSLVAGPPVDPDLIAPEKRKNKREDTSLD